MKVDLGIHLTEMVDIYRVFTDAPTRVAPARDLIKLSGMRTAS
jgi:hypothetical protein